MGLAQYQTSASSGVSNWFPILEMESTMEGPLSFILFFFVLVPFVLMNISAYRKERKKADEELKELLEENNKLLKEFLDK
jgi:cbb3-type cytochrome oxidase subunit 3